MEVVAAAPRLQLLLIVLVTVMLLLGMKVSPLLVRRKITRTIELQESIGKGFPKDAFIPRKQESEELTVVTMAGSGNELHRIGGTPEEGWEEKENTVKLDGCIHGFSIAEIKHQDPKANVWKSLFRNLECTEASDECFLWAWFNRDLHEDEWL
ncbi:hypothetical protein STEG23_037608, partial [Scotinomys teguina]